MPVLDGIEATRLIKASEATRQARVIAYTGNSTLDNGAVERLFDAVVHKPASPSVILATVQQLARG
jgi:CheY-like chemotaxis protein